jgi:catechol 2,3-dioxygenase-like lactoylglutathione lyase family enzyme
MAFNPSHAFSGFSVDDLATARKFYGETLGLEVRDVSSWKPGTGHDDAADMMSLHPREGVAIHVYPKPNHEPATFTILNFPVPDVEAVVDELTSRGVTFERYPGMESDERGIHRGTPDHPVEPVAWFKDPAGNVLAIIEER